MEKLIKNGKVAVVVSKGYGAGWSTWNEHAEFLSMDKRIAEAVLNKDFDTVKKICEEELKDEHVSYLGLYDCVVKWVPQGTVFEIMEYDGAELIRVYNPEGYMTA